MEECRAREWLRQMPNYASAAPIAEVEADSLTASEFRTSFVERMKPCIVRNAIRHWPAMQLWQSPGYLRQQVGNAEIQVQIAPCIEHPGAARKNPALLERMERSRIRMSFDGFLGRITSNERGHCALHGSPVSAGYPLAPLSSDVGGFHCIDHARRPRVYPGHRAFIYRDSYTDWHFHFTDETFMCQIKGRKEVLLLPPDGKSFKTMVEIVHGVGHVYDTDPAKFPMLQELRPLRAMVDCGDALYIPTFWWHAVESRDADWGITLSWCWRTPLHLFDARLAGVRHFMKRLVRTPMGPIAVSVAGYSLLHRCVTGGLAKPPFEA